MNLEQLKKRASAYIKGNVKKIYATEDGNFFYTEHKAFAEAHERQSKSKLHLIDSSDLIEEKVVKNQSEKVVKKQVVKNQPEIIKEEPENKDAEN